MKKKLFFVLILFCTVFGGYAAGKKENLAFIGQTGNYANSVKALAERMANDTQKVIDVYDVAYSSLHENIMLDLSSGSGSYDLVMTNASWLEECSQYFIDLGPYVKKAGIDLSKFSKSTIDACTINGVLYALPVAPTPNMMAYRTDLVKNPPKTWDEYLKIAASYTDSSKGMYGVSLPGAKAQCAVLFLVRLWSMGQDVADENWNVIVDSPIGRKAMQHLKDTMQYADPACLTWGLNEAHAAFLQGNAVFCEAWPTLGIAQKADNPELSKIKGKWAMAPFPEDTSGVKQMSLQCFGISKNCKDIDTAFNFIKEYVSYDYQAECYKKYSTLPSLLQFYDSDSIRKSPLAALGDGFRGVCLTKWNIYASAEQDTIMTNAVGSFMAGEMDLDAVMKYYSTNLKRVLSETKPKYKNEHAVQIKQAVKNKK